MVDFGTQKGQKCKNDTISIVKNLQIQLYNRLDDEEEGENRSCQVTMNCKLLSFDPNINPILAKIENMEFKGLFFLLLFYFG